jgi:hypothetical protein
MLGISEKVYYAGPHGLRVAASRPVYARVGLRPGRRQGFS